MQTLIEDLLEYSHVTTKNRKTQPVDCNEILKKVMLSLQISIKESNAKIVCEPPPTIQSDSGQLSRLFQNLIINAIKFCKNELPEIRIETKKQDKEWLFLVRDNGIGIKPEFAKRIFEIFQRLHTRKEYSGTGIGLAICKKIVERHGGQIWVESEEGNGSTFYFTIHTLP
jgi:light-regulated signal transduction histidine kinase (bacteriophytochrome)